MTTLCSMKREEIEKIYDQGKEAVVEFVEDLIRYSMEIRYIYNLLKNSYNS
jgi:hypothetical protein